MQSNVKSRYEKKSKKYNFFKGQTLLPHLVCTCVPTFVNILNVAWGMHRLLFRIAKFVRKYFIIFTIILDNAFL